METEITGSIATTGPSHSENQEEPIANQDVAHVAAADAGSGPTVDAPKASMMAKLGSNYLIPKNKALVPVTRTTSKWEPLDPKKEEPKPMSRKTKWGPDLTLEPAVKRGRALALQTRAEQLAAQLEANNLEIDYNEATRSPSPPPLYDSMGHRMNTREGRKRDMLDVERRDAIGECMKLNPSFKPPSGYRPVLKEAKLFIPVRDHPGYNFIGLILGPRGNTQKRLEADTCCKITIRGKGSIKDGKTVPYRHGKDNDGTSEDLHVHIAAETTEKVDAAVAIIAPLLIPVDEDRNIYKMKQLRELAEMNGTVRDFLRICTLCGEEGHKEWQCPKDKLQTFQAKVICRLCGDGSHPTMDCPLKHSGQGKTIDKEYLSFLQELGADLGGIDKSDSDLQARTHNADTSQPMLLTASGAQPMPSSWMGLESDNMPKFPFPFPFPFPPGAGPQGMNPMNFFPRFFNPAFFQMLRGRPLPPPSLQMMAFMFSAFRGRFPFPPLGPRPNMMRPPIPSSLEPEGPLMDNPTSTQNQANDLAGGAAQNNSDPVAQSNSEVLPPSVSTFDRDVKHPSGVLEPHSISSPEVPSYRLPPFLADTASPGAPPPFEMATSFQSAGDTTPIFSPSSTPNVLPVEGLSAGYVIPPMPLPPPPPPHQLAVPSYRPFPSVRPVIPPPGQSPSFTPFGGSGLPLPATPSWVGIGNVSSSCSLDNLSKPSQMWASPSTWSQGQFSMEASSSSQSIRPVSECASPQNYPKASNITSGLPTIDTLHANSAENLTPFSSTAGSGPSLYSTLHPLSASSQFGYAASRTVPYDTTAVPPSTAQGQLGAALYASHPQDGHRDSSFRLPAMGSHIRAGGFVNATPPVEDYHPCLSSSERSSISQRHLPVYPPDAPSSLRFQSGQDHQQRPPFSAAEFAYARAEDFLHSGSHLHAEYRNADPRRIEGQRLSGVTTAAPPADTFGGGYRYEPSIPLNLLKGSGSLCKPWNVN